MTGRRATFPPAIQGTGRRSGQVKNSPEIIGTNSSQRGRGPKEATDGENCKLPDDRRVPEAWRRANVVPVFKQGQKEEPGNNRPVSQTDPWELRLKPSICEYLEDEGQSASGQHGFTETKSCQTGSISFSSGATGLVAGGRRWP